MQKIPNYATEKLMVVSDDYLKKLGIIEKKFKQNNFDLTDNLKKSLARYSQETVEKIVRLTIKAFTKGLTLLEIGSFLKRCGFILARNAIVGILRQNSEDYNKNGWQLSKERQLISFFASEKKRAGSFRATYSTAKKFGTTRPAVQDILDKYSVKYDAEIFIRNFKTNKKND